MNAKNENDQTAERLRDALGAAADLMLKGREGAYPPFVAPAPSGAQGRRRPGRAWLAPLAAGAAVVAVVLASVLVVNGIGGQARNGSGAAPAGAAAGPPEFYLAQDSTGHSWPLEVHRTSNGAITDSEPFPGSMLQRGYLAADASGRAFYFASFPTCTEATPVTRFHRITINASGRIISDHAVGSRVSGIVGSMAISPDGSKMAYTMNTTGWCENPRTQPGPPTAIHVMDLSTGVVRTWRNTVTTPGPRRVADLFDGLSWTPDGRTLIANAYWGNFTSEDTYDFSVLGLDTTTAGGSLQASSHVLRTQDHNCVICVQDAIAGPDGSLTAVVLEYHGGKGIQMVVGISGQNRLQYTRLLYSAVAPPEGDLKITAVFADPSGRWVITWPPADEMAGSGSDPRRLRAGWIRDGKLATLSGTTLVHPDAIAW